MAYVMITATDPTNTVTNLRFNKTHVFETAIKKYLKLKFSELQTKLSILQ